MLAFRRDVLAIMVNRVDINTILLLFWFKIKMMEGKGGGQGERKGVGVKDHLSLRFDCPVLS